MPRPRQDVKRLRRYLYMKYYVLETINNGATVKVNKKFKSRDKAIRYAFTYFERRNLTDQLQVEDEYAIDNNKHNVEYV